jgi:hypothetical protein
VCIVYANELLRFGNFIHYRFSHMACCDGNRLGRIIAGLYCLDDPEQAFLIRMKPVIAQFILGIKKDEHAYGEPDAKTQDLDNGKCLIPPKISKRGFKIVFYHGYYFILCFYVRFQNFLVVPPFSEPPLFEQCAQSKLFNY